ncbi:nitrate reductase [NADH]-like [Cornus florida]|uniref:nitrate reductase [NADH]-like n=1 Tax=Cornus florida TaxID=4283 RepID=UPI0028A0C70A|nr:nitrate reductase [NADH]-like [Cornus florida]
MAAYVQNRQFGPGLTGISSYNSGSSHRSNSPGRGCNFPPILELTRQKKPVVFDDSSSEDESGNDYRDIIGKGNGELEPSVLDPRDEGTADCWIDRNPSLIRLTGRHPFNSEPPLARLMHHGFITPVPLHYVRNHGYVPKGTWEDWTVEVTGLIKRPARFTMDQLVNDFPTRELPVTLVCAGNRRKEQNVVKQSIGFNWGAAAVSTSVWRGVPLRYILKKCGIYSRRNGALNVCFEGAEDLPGGGGSKYGTSLRKEVAMDPSRDIILAYMQNGELLSPDHGFPIRIIIPGFIGGRMVKWLKRIIVTTQESDSYYHFRDNRVLPSHVDEELANVEGWWYKPEYIINELNINSVITTPSHEEILPINSFTTQMPYTLRGYAYSGGGKKVTRVEVTMDGGDTWQVCTLDLQETPNRYGKHWCWCFWSVELEVLDLLSATKEIAVRAWDESLSTQPQTLIWNLMVRGMMNNCWFRVKVNVCRGDQGEIGIVFEHPTQPGNDSGGWMARERQLRLSAEMNQSVRKSLSTPFMITSSRKYSMTDVAKHNSADSAWIIVYGHVYDATGFLKDHPGGADSILINAGTDCTEDFDVFHSDGAKKLLEQFRVGELMSTCDTSSSDSTNSSPNNSVHGASHLASIKEVAPARSVALVPRQKIKCKLISKRSISHGVQLFRFGLPSEELMLGLPVGKYIFLFAEINDKLCIRAYTPTSPIDEVGNFNLLVKIYPKGVNSKFPNGGVMTQYLDSLPLESVIEVKGPLGHIEYTSRGNFTAHGKHKFARRLAMVAGGTGITPIYQVTQAILNDPDDHTEMWLVYANRTEDDILLRDELDRWAEEHSDRLKVWYVVEKSIRGRWAYSVGMISESVLKDHVPGASKDTLALACGPPLMIQFGVQPNLEKLGYDVKDSLLVF